MAGGMTQQVLLACLSHLQCNVIGLPLAHKGKHHILRDELFLGGQWTNRFDDWSNIFTSRNVTLWVLSLTHAAFF